MSGDWISIWELAQEYWPTKPRYFASRLLNYSILNDLPRRVGDIQSAIASDVERLYNISVNSPNVDRITREVFLSHSLIRSHIESKRFNPDDRYLPRRPRQEEYLISKPSEPVTYIPVGDSTTPSAEEERFNYFARMGIPYGVTRKKGIPVSLDYRQNLIVDRDAPQLREVASKLYPAGSVEVPPGADETPSRLGSINSEEALLWNVFRFLMREEGLRYFLKAGTLSPGAEKVAHDERISAAWFWGMNDRGSPFLPLTQAIEALGESPEKRVVPGLILLGINEFMIIEGRYASLFLQCPYLKQDECPGPQACSYWTGPYGVSSHLPTFVERNDVQRTCGRHFHLMRLHLLVKAMSQNPTMGRGRVVSVIDENQEAGSINRKLFLDFTRSLPGEDQGSFTLTSWQKIKAQIPFEPRFEELHREFREKWSV